MIGDAAVWARPYLETIADNKVAFTDWSAFIAAFKAKFEPINAEVKAKSKIMNMKQGSRTFSSYLSEFEMWSSRTGWSDQDLYDHPLGLV